MAVLHKLQRQTYTAIDNEALRDPSLSWRATGLLAYLLSLPEGWTIRGSDLANRKTDGRTAVQTTMAELEAAGYLSRVKFQDASGRWSTTITVAESPSLLSAETAPVSVDSPTEGHPTLGATDTRLEAPLRKDSEGTTNQETLSSSEVATEAVATRSPDQQRLDEIKEALVAVGLGPTQRGGWALVNRVATMIRDRDGGSADVAERAALMAADWGPSKVTLTSLEKHWARYDPGKIGRVSQAQVDAWKRAREAEAESEVRLAQIEQVQRRGR